MLKPDSFSSLRNQMASHVHLAKVLYSDSQEDLEVELCFFEDQEMGVEPFVNRYPLVEVLSSKFPI